MKPSQKPPQKPTGFGNKSFVSREDFRQWVRKQPDAWKYGSHLTPDQRVRKIEQDMWGKSTSKWGSYIEKSKNEPERRKKELYKELRSSQTRRDPKQRKAKTYNIKLLDRFMGKN